MYEWGLNQYMKKEAKHGYQSGSYFNHCREGRRH